MAERLYTVEYLETAEKSLLRLPKQVVQRVRGAIQALKVDPRPPGSKKLKGEGDKWRIRVGDYRVVYLIEDGNLVILIIDVGHRKDIYR